MGNGTWQFLLGLAVVVVAVGVVTYGEQAAASEPGGAHDDDPPGYIPVEPPQDIDGDGLYEDIDADGEFDIFDVQAMFEDLANGT